MILGIRTTITGTPITASELGAARKLGVHYKGITCWCGENHGEHEKQEQWGCSGDGEIRKI